MTERHRVCPALVALLAALGFSCGGDKSPPAVAEPAPPPPAPVVWSEVSLHRAIREANPGYTGNGQFQITPQGVPEAVILGKCGISDIGMLAGMPLRLLDLMECPVSDLGAIQGMPLMELYLEGSNVEELSTLAGNTTLKKLYLTSTNVKDLGPLKGLPIEELNLIGCRAGDLGPLAGMPLKMLWLTGLPVTDVSPLAATPLVSLTLHRTRVENLQPLATLRTLQRLHVGDTPVKDLTPISGLPLTRLVFTPATIEKGIEAVRQIPSMQQLGVEFEEDLSTLMDPGIFWARFDQGELGASSVPAKN